MPVDSKEIQAQKDKAFYYKSLNDIANQIHSARSMDEIFLNLTEQILSFFDTRRISIYVVDSKRKELYQRLKAGGSTPEEIRVPINNESIAGYTANNAQMTNISNAYDKHELAMINRDLSFDKSWDEKNNFVTKQVLTVPIFFKNSIIGVLQLINKNNGHDSFSIDDQNSAVEMAKVLGIAFYNQIKLAQKNKKKGRFDYLLNNSLITHKELEQAVKISRERKELIETIFINDFKVSKNEVGKSLAEFYGCEYISYDSNFPIPGDLLTKLKQVYLKSNLWVPLARQNGNVKILIDNPQRLDKVDSIKALIPSKTWEFAVGLKEDILQFLDYFYGTPQIEDNDSIHDIMAKLDTDDSDMDDEDDMMTEDDSAIVQLVNKIITDGFRKNTSDIHIEPYPGKEGAEIRFRVDGACTKYQTIPYHYKRAIVSRLKIMSELDISERRKPQDGKIKFKKYSPLDIELRVATIPTVGGEEDVVMRILAAGEPISLDAMGFSKRDHDLFTNLISQPYGIVLVVGPTGSGKTTTLHAALKHINKPDTKIWTAEDPVEITQKGLRQVQVQPKIGFDFAAAMRAFLRADPDVIMVGEMRDHETVATGIEASLTGHLVFSTLHTNSAPETITRLLDMGMDPFNFADALLGVLAQRLVRTLCKDCKEAYHPDRKEYDDLVRAYAGNFDALGFPYTDDLKLYRANGCDKCNNTGYRGRTGIVELLNGTDEMQTLIQGRSKMELLREQAVKDGMTTLMQDGIRKVFLGQTDIQQVRKVCIK